MHCLLRVSFEEGAWTVTNNLKKTGPYASRELAVSIAAAMACFVRRAGAAPRIEVEDEAGTCVAVWPSKSEN
jgi:hypothetical protein